MFSVRLVTADSYQATPLSQLDPTYSEFRGAEIKNVPIVRVFGTTPTGEKTCLHLHGAFPYMYVPFTGEYSAEIFPYKLATSLDSAINVSLGSAMSNTQHVYRIERVAGIPYYGYHEREHQFLKVYFYNPAMIKRATDLLQNGSVLNTRLQPHEAHIPYILQFMMDYNLHGMSFINLSNVKYRCVSQLLPESEQINDSIISPEKIVEFLPSSIVRQSVCQFEVDALVSDLQNRQELLKGIKLNPGLAAIWKEERARRAQNGLPNEDSQLANPTSLKRSVYHGTESDIHQQHRLNRRLQFISQCDESSILTSTASTPYPLEVSGDTHLINASNLGNSCNNPENSQHNLSDVNNLTSPEVSHVPVDIQTQHDSSLLNVEDIQLVEMLIELAHDSEDHVSIDDDSVLGSQLSKQDKTADNDGIEDEDDVADLNITCLELDQISLGDNIRNSPSQLIPVNILEADTKVLSSSRGEILTQDINHNSHDPIEMPLTQLDGLEDELNFLESDEDEGVTGYKELKCVSATNDFSKKNGEICNEKTKSLYELKFDRAAIPCLNIKSIKYVNKLKNLRTKLRDEHEKSDISTSHIELSYDNLNNCISTVMNQFEWCQDSDRFFRLYKTSTGHRDKLHTVNVNEKVVLVKITINEQQLQRKSLIRRFPSNVRLCLLKPRKLDWLSEHIMVGSIQFQQPHNTLQRFSSSKLKYYSYPRRFKTDAFKKRFKATVKKLTIPAFDGPADLSSSDSEPDADPTSIELETRVCMYQSLKKKIEHEAIITPKKRKQSHNDEDEKIDKCKHAKCCTIQQRSDTSKKTSCSSQKCIWCSSGVSDNYPPWKILVTSPNISKAPHVSSDELCFENSSPVVNSNSVCTSPNRHKQLLNEVLVQSKIVSSISDEKGDDYNLKMNIGQRFMDTRASNTELQSFVVFPHRPNQGQDVHPNIENAENIREIPFLSTDNSSLGELLPSHRDIKINKRGELIKSTTALCDSKIVGPSNYSEVEGNSDNVNEMLNHSVGEICQNYSMSIDTKELKTNEDELCNVTFTQYLNLHKPKPPLLSCSIRNEILSGSAQSVSILPKFDPPTIKQVIDTMRVYSIPEFKNSQPVFGNYADAVGQKEIVHRMLNVPAKSVINLPAFKSNMENITGLNCWRRMTINEFYSERKNQLYGEKFESKNLRQSIAGKASVVILPLISAPIPKNVRKWLKARDYLRTVQKKSEVVIAPRNHMKENQNSKNNVGSILKNECTNIFDPNISSGSPEKTTMSNHAELGQTSNIYQKDENFQSGPIIQIATGGSTMISGSGEIAPSLESILAKSTLFKKTVQSEKFGTSFGQIDCLSHTIQSNVVHENMQNCKVLPRYQFITIFCVEVHVSTRHNLLPNPQYDQISALFYAIQNDVPPTSSIKPLQQGVILICSEGENKSNYCYGSKIPFDITFVADEKGLFDALMDIVNCSDAEILIGWEIESLSWGYIFQRASRLGINLIKGMSRVPTSQWRWDSQMSDKSNSLVDMKLPGRIVLDVWRIIKNEIALLTYTFENVMYHVMNERLPRPSFQSLTKWWKSTPSRWKVVQHYCTMILGILRILEQLDIIGRTSEFARLFGIQLYEVFSRGSQYRVESIMLRLAKPLNYVAVSPSLQQRSSMRAMEALPLIMEPESMFYSDPIVVLDFQSLYPSIIIAHNYCYSTCLGRIEHIGEPNPFEFGTSVLRVPKHTALKLQDKVNYAPCGVAFVKSEVRFGILPRMLTEILNTRLMVKKTMKDYSQDDKLLQRILHSRQKGLKDLANVTYGYTAANFTGRMPCVEVGDSIVSKAKETLERAIKLVESMSQWGARVIYGDTDSLFILIPGKSKSDAFKIGYEIADAVTASNLSPIKLKFEKILQPAILQSKKRYCGYMYETLDQDKPKFLAKGIETVRRDGCPAVSKILEKSLRILFDTKDVSLLKQYVTRQLNKILSGKVLLEDLTFAKEFRGMNGYKERACVPALELTRRLLKKDPRALPRRSERVRYVIVAGAPNQALIHCVRSPWELIDDPGLRLNGVYYVTRVIIPPLNRCLNLMGVDVNIWYKEMTHRQMIRNPVAIPENKQKQTISQYFGTVVCASCDRTSNRGICNDCLSNPTETLVVLHERLKWLESIYHHITTICQSCVGRGHIVDCVSLDCPVLYRRCQAQRDLTQGTILQKMIETGDNFDF